MWHPASNAKNLWTDFYYKLHVNTNYYKFCRSIPKTVNFLLFRASGKKYSVPHCKTSLFLNTQSISLALWSLCGISNSKQHFNAKSSWDWREIPPLKNNYRLLRIIRVWRTFPALCICVLFPSYMKLCYCTITVWTMCLLN